MAPLAEHLSLIPRKTGTSLGGITAIGGSGNDDSGLSIAARVGIALGVMAGVAAIGAAFYVWLVRKRRRRVAPMMRASKKMERDSSVEEPRAPPGVHVRPGFDAAKGMR
jgi:hypothetical protein